MYRIMLKRYIAAISACVMCLTLLVGCVTRKPSYDLPDNDTTSAPETTAAPEQTTSAPETTPAPETTAEPVFDPAAPVEYKYQKYHIEVSLAAQIVYIYDLTETGEKGELVKAMLCSTGREGHETPEQKWIILSEDIKQYSNYRMQWLNGGVTGQFMTRIWNISEENGTETYSWSSYLFHSSPYAGMSSEKLKADEWNKLGTPASDGCIRLTTADAKWIYTYVAPYSYVYTIQGEEDPELWAKLKLDPIPSDATRDPTDVDKYPEV